MPIPTLAPDAELITRTYLVGIAELVARVGTDENGEVRVYTKLPTGGGKVTLPTTGFLRLRRLLAPPRGNQYRREMIGAAIQLDAYGGSKRDAFLIIETALAALEVMPAAAHDGAIVSAVEFGPAGYLPDPDLLTAAGNARERYVADVTVVARPART